MRVLIIGSGGREHAIAWKLLREGHEVFAAPGNPGIRFDGGSCVPLDIKDFNAVSNYVVSKQIGFTIVGPEAPLVAGIVDHFNALGLPIFGPTKAAAEIEASKSFCCSLLEMAKVPIPGTWYYDSFEDMQDAIADSDGGIVLKKSGLAAGKGAEVVHLRTNLEQALARLEKLDDGYGDGQFLVQNLVEGTELSYFVLTDGIDFVFMGSAQDYKPLYAGGPNTGGMGGFSPHPILTPELREVIDNTIVRPTITALATDGRPYRGVLYFQLMVTKGRPVVIEINCRFGDPETQLIMPLLNCRLLPLLQATTESGALRRLSVSFDQLEVSVGIVMASEGYPDDPKLGREIKVLGQGVTGFEVSDFGPVGPVGSDSIYAQAFHAGTKFVDGKLVTSGGRVLTVVGTWFDYAAAKRNALAAVAMIEFEGEYHRTDIADEAVISESW